MATKDSWQFSKYAYKIPNRARVRIRVQGCMYEDVYHNGLKQFPTHTLEVDKRVLLEEGIYHARMKVLET